MLIPLPLPPLDEAEQAHSARVAACVRAELERAGGWLPFARWMELVLYAPGLGYYSAGAHKLGAGGDFVTAPELSPVFARCLATQCAEVLDAVGPHGEILELGAGSGALAGELLAELARQERLPARYRILEIGADLRARQRAHLASLPPALATRVEWLDAPPAEPFAGLVLGNEVVDALPVERFRRTLDGVESLGVRWNGARFECCARAADPALAAAVAALEQELGARLPAEHVGELRPQLPAWLETVTRPLAHGLALFLDYGHARRDHYAPERAGGTVACFFRHRRHDDPFLHPGLQDLTAWVDFTQLAEAGLACGLELAGYATQAAFLVANGFDRHLEALQAAAPDHERAFLARAAARLVLPNEMGERFRCMGLARGLARPPRGFAAHDLVHTL